MIFVALICVSKFDTNFCERLDLRVWWGLMLVARRGGGAKACMRVSSGEEGLMEYFELGRHAFWPFCDFLLRFNAFCWTIFVSEILMSYAY